MTRTWPICALLTLMFAAAGCGEASKTDGSAPSGPGLAGVGQGGAQDFGQFRQILDAGGIPGPETLDDVGFFNEHVVRLPAPECGQDVCLHALYGAMDNMISGSPCTVLLLGMNTTITPESLERPPLHLTLVVDGSGSMNGTPLAALKGGLIDMLPELDAADRVSLVRFASEAQVLATALAPDDPALVDAVQGLVASGQTNLYDGLRVGYDVAVAEADGFVQNRVILLSDGVQNVGITSAERAKELARGYASLGFGLTTIGVGTQFDVVLMRDLAEIGAGAFYFVEDPEAVDEVFREEVNVFLVPLAEEAHIEVRASNPWDPRGVYGTKLFDVGPVTTVIDIPTLQIAGRTRPSDNETGRRGGGGAMLIEMLPSGDGPMVGEVASIDFSYREPGTGKVVAQTLTPLAPLSAAEEPRWFEDATVEKGFVMLNLFVGFHMAAERAVRGDDGAALGVLDALELNVSRWLEDTPDPDIADDLVYVRRFIANLEARATDPERPDVVDEPWPRD